MKKIPDNAKKVFEGVFFSVWQWEQELYDGTTKTFEYVSRPDVSTVIAVTKDNKILLLEEEQPTQAKTFTFPSGVIDEGETPELCALRELKEETGYVSTQIEKWFSYSAGKRVWCDYHIYIAKNCEKQLTQHLDSGEKITAQEVKLEDLLEKIEEIPFKNFSIYPHLIKAKYNIEYRQKLKDLLGITT